RDRARVRSQQGCDLCALQPRAPRESVARGQGRAAPDDRAGRARHALRDRLVGAERPRARAAARAARAAVPVRAEGRRADHDDEADRLLPGLTRARSAATLAAVTVERIHEFWFGPRPWTAAALEERMAFWFGRADEAERAERDAAIGREFGASIERAAAGELSAWAREPRGRLCLILLLDQFPRNVHRGTARAFAYDAAALELALDGIAAGMDRALDPVERVFFYMPLQ